MGTFGLHIGGCIMWMNMNMDTFVPIGSPSGQWRACTCGVVLNISSVDSACFQHEQHVDENLHLEDISPCNSASSTWLPSAHFYCKHFCTRTRVWTDFPLLLYKQSPGSSASTSINSKYLFLQVLFYSFECRARWWVRVPGQYFTKVCQCESYPNRWKKAVMAASVPPKC